MIWIDAAGWLAAALTLAAHSMRTMLPLRSTAICANLAFIVYGIATGIYPMLVLHLFLLPLNIARLGQILRDRKWAKDATHRDGFDALRPYMRPVSVEAGRYIFRKGDRADRVYLIESGEVWLSELDITLGPGALLGEVAFFTGSRTRTASALCRQPSRLLATDERGFVDAHYQDPALGLLITRLIATRLYDGPAPDRGCIAEPEAHAAAESAGDDPNARP